jgi:lysyl-tRNA synthetase class II
MDDTNSLIEQSRNRLKQIRERYKDDALITQRLDKLDGLLTKKIDPFQNKFTPTESCDAARKNYAEGREVSVAGRITAHREMGKSMFIDVRDQSGRIQVYAQKNVLGEELWNIFTHLDLGDFVGVRGTLFTTKTGEISIKLGSGTGVSPVSSENKNATHGQDARATTETAQPPFVILAKALRPPPAKWHGLEDTEIRYRQRYLDLIANPDVKKIFLQRSEIVHEIRQFFHARGYVEVETPAMQAIPGGAAAQPFKTFHNALGCEFYLRIALELYHKRLLVGGIDKLFEIGKNFRNEGLSRRHNPEFTMLEAYCAFGDYATMMETVESLITTVAQKINNTLKVAKGCSIDSGRAEITAFFKTIETDFLTQLPNELIKAGVTGNDLQAAQAEIKIAFEPAIEAFSNLRSEIIHGVRPEFWEVAKLMKDVLYALFSKLEDLHQRFPDRFVGDGGSRRLSDLKTHGIFLKKFSELEIIDLAPPWRRPKYKDLVREVAGQDWFEISRRERFDRAIEMEIDFKQARLVEMKKRSSLLQNQKDSLSPIEWDRLYQEHMKAFDSLFESGKGILPEDFEITGAVFEKYVEPKLNNPTFVTHLPKELVPLAKLSPDDPTTVEVFECCINGQEISPGYTEQNDPIAQRTTLEHQAGGEQQKLDEDFLVALEHGMPPAGGIGIGIDRLCMMLLGQESIRDVILFPQLKPK